MSGHDDYADEPIPGLPAHLPAGERMLWQGSPDWLALARHGFHWVSLAVYFALLVLWRVLIAFQSGESFSVALKGTTWLMGLGITALLVVGLLAWLAARSTIYTITTQRVLMRFGIALPMTLNLPFTAIESASMKSLGHERGDIALQTTREQRVAFLVTWPHVRPWRITRPQPSLRALPQARQVAGILSAALQQLPVPEASVTLATPPQAAPTHGLDVVTA